MLIFTRGANQSFYIEDNIIVTVLGIKGNQVRIGVDAPPGVAVHREEVMRKIGETERNPIRRPSPHDADI